MMKMINLELSQEQYKTLIKLAFLGGYISASNDDETPGEFQQLEQYIYSYAKDFGMDEWVTVSEDSGSYGPTDVLAEEVIPLLEEYEEIAFWDNLIWRLAERDIAEETGQEEFAKMDPEDQFTQILVRADEYLDEFETNGIINLYLE